MEFENKVVLITGASRGIGAAAALMFAENGANVVINYFSKKEKAEEISKKIEELGRKSIIIQADVAKIKEVEDMVSKIIKEFGTIDILVNNAGVGRQDIITHGMGKNYILDVTEEEWDIYIDTHLKGTFNCCKNVLPYMIKERCGRIINISSVVGESGGLGASVQYAAAKAGIIGFTKALAHQVAKDNITVNVVSPGMIATERIQYRTSEQMAEHTKKIPAGRVGKSEEIAAAIYYLASYNAAYITGATIDVNGGMYMR